MCIRDRTYTLLCPHVTTITMVYEGKTGPRFEVRLREFAKGEGNRTTNSQNTMHFIETGHKFIHLMEMWKY